MVYTKVQIYNLALSALLINRKVADIDSDNSTDVKTLNTHWDIAWNTTLQDLDLDSTSSSVALELIEEEPNPHWNYAYKYPVDCSFLRRIRSSVVKDNRSTQIPRRVAIHEGQKAILTNEYEAVAEYIPEDLDIGTLSAPAGLAVAYRLAMLSNSLVTGKASKELKAEIEKKYIIAKTEAQELDRLENANFDEDEITSEFVEVRTT